jgi:hypothetical protein
MGIGTDTNIRDYGEQCFAKMPLVWQDWARSVV